MGWRDSSHSSVGRDWGNPPSLVELIAATIRLPSGLRTPAVYSLDNRGQRGEAIPLSVLTDGAVEFTLRPEYKTLWYEVDYADTN
jgi:hypothetical protein